MDELGSLLREAREAKGLTLSEAQESTRINSSYLQALEDGRYDLLPSQVHVRGYLRNYAKFLTLDSKPLLERYELSQASYAASAPTERVDEPSDGAPLQSRADRVFYDPVNMEVGNVERRDSGSFVRIIIILALVAAVALIAMRAYQLLTGSDEASNGLAGSIEEVVSEITNGAETGAAATIDPAIIPGAGDTITSTNRNAAIQMPTPTATRPSLPATLETIQMRLEVTERSWMQVTIDDEIVFQGIAKNGDEPYEWEAQDSATLLSGNGIGLFVTINDIPLGRLGGRGEVVEETWTTTASE